MNPTGKKFVSLFLVFSLMMLSINLHSKEKRGAKLIVTKKDGQQVESELIAVKPTSLLLLNTEGKDVSFDIADIRIIRIVKKSKFRTGTQIGGFTGVVFGTILGVLTGKESYVGPELNVVIGGAFFCFLGLLIGGTIGVVAGTDKTIHFEGMNSYEVNKTLDYLRKKARIRDYM